MSDSNYRPFRQKSIIDILPTIQNEPAAPQPRSFPATMDFDLEEFARVRSEFPKLKDCMSYEEFKRLGNGAWCFPESIMEYQDIDSWAKKHVPASMMKPATRCGPATVDEQTAFMKDCIKTGFAFVSETSEAWHLVPLDPEESATPGHLSFQIRKRDPVVIETGYRSERSRKRSVSTRGWDNITQLGMVTSDGVSEFRLMWEWGLPVIWKTERLSTGYGHALRNVQKRDFDNVLRTVKDHLECKYVWITQPGGPSIARMVTNHIRRKDQMTLTNTSEILSRRVPHDAEPRVTIQLPPTFIMDEFDSLAAIQLTGGNRRRSFDMSLIPILLFVFLPTYGTLSGVAGIPLPAEVIRYISKFVAASRVLPTVPSRAARFWTEDGDAQE